jgi:hypothetical protein
MARTVMARAVMTRITSRKYTLTSIDQIDKVIVRRTETVMVRIDAVIIAVVMQSVDHIIFYTVSQCSCSLPL